MNGRTRGSLLMVMAVGTGVFYGLRGLETGTDTGRYGEYFVAQADWLNIGLVWLNRLLYPLLNGDPQAYLLVISLIMSICFAAAYRIIFGNHKYVCFAYTVLYMLPYTILMHVNIMRQGLSLSFMLLGFALIYVKGKKWAVILVVFASLTHNAMSMLCIGAIFLKLSNKRIVFLVVASLCLMPVSAYVGDFLSHLMGFGDTFSRYSSRDGNTAFYIKYIFYGFNYIVMLWLDAKERNRTYHALTKIMGLMMVMASFFFDTGTVIQRFLLSAEIIIPVIYFQKYAVFKERRLYIAGILVLFSLYFIYIINDSSIQENLRLE